jgi:hypothetical protein
VETRLDLQILGVSQWPWDRYHELMYGGRSLPWLKETRPDSVWHRWDINYRDVVILDVENVPIAVFNLSSHNLRDRVEYDSLKTLLLQTTE